MSRADELQERLDSLPMSDSTGINEVAWDAIYVIRELEAALATYQPYLERRK